ncbi:ABC transporter permease [Bdellovibrio sp. SKB1291214]|uniref:ABC transporter permease n=1 Tax=Bdellovibrio sp. SKB1291214 TaxID=1732569 RepID=UPI000B5187C6|nr:ABC transporter permease [Bdellovibrio sp. SKB1291214]UYL09488.1 ABC transporter permease [Bdellovibrio sp. SKB1291214]
MSNNWVRFLIKKSFEIFASLAVLVALSFLLLKALPGGPFDDEAALHPTVKATLSEQWGLQQSTLTQSFKYLTSLLHGDLGVSMAHPDQQVSSIIAKGFGNTLSLNLATLVLVILAAFALSLLSQRYRDSWFEKGVDQLMITFISLPSLFWGPLLIYLFGFYLDLLPTAFLSEPRNYILPILTLGVRPLASLVRILKTSLKQNYDMDYVRTAKSKGVEEWDIIVRHVLRNSLIPFLSYLGPLLVGMLSGSFLVEMLFAIPGLGGQFIMALSDRDYTLIVGLTLFYGSMLILVNSFIDVLMRAADPRMRDEA